MKLRRLLLRYHPPGIILQYDNHGTVCERPVDLLELDLTSAADVEVGTKKVAGRQHKLSA
jgi:dynein assembly factor with WDR repeat domains 1